MYKAVFIDMDGTLLRKDHTVSTANTQAVKSLLDKGILVVPVSARPLHGIIPITRHIIPGHMPVVSLNGSYIFHNEEIIFQVAIALPQLMAVHNELQAYPVSAMYYSQMEWFSVVEDAMVKKEQKITPVKITIQAFNDTLERWERKKAGPNKILIAGHKDVILAIEQRLLQLHGNNLNIYKSQPSYLEVMSQAASKTKAIEFLLKKYGLVQEEIVAIGDNYNDKGMIEFAGAGVAMGNAPDEIKSVADYITDTNSNDGVAKALDHFFS